ncbi:hypothetical protein IC235_09265 [Hymenobacter sp. BT664]|uniref:Uncharacterized protein n=1 Tax=Hymenobacter montanus TaxID=2771359 RepID=A0A927BDF8_9BACT|nr:hypothetical protein [Hymenobacter montanus]MBD2768078.1 hypothetical protein [Hymenobacter montanus]
MAYDESFAETLEDSTYTLEAYDEAYDNESDEAYDNESDEAYDEATRRRYRRPPVAKGRYNRPSRPYTGRATLNTPAGPASLKLPADLVRKDELRAALAAISSDIKKNSQAVLKINANLNDLNGKDGKSTNALSKRITETDRKIAALQQQQLFSLLLPTRIEEITIQDPNGTDGTRLRTEKVDSIKVDNTNALMVSMMSGGFGGGGNSMTSMMPMLLLLTQKENTIGGSGSKDNTMMMVMMMMMMNQNQNPPK